MALRTSDAGYYVIRLRRKDGTSIGVTSQIIVAASVLKVEEVLKGLSATPPDILKRAVELGIF
jgi:hypothetical protein